MTDRTVNISKEMMKKLEEACETHKPRYKPWTLEEEQILINYHGKICIHKLAEILGRSCGSISKKYAEVR